MVRLTFEKYTYGSYFLALILIITISFYSWQSTDDMIDDANWVNHTQEVLTRLASFLSNVTDAETGYRGFVITGNELFLESYNKALNQIDLEFKLLKQLTTDNPVQQISLQRLHTLIQEKLIFSKEVIELCRNNDFVLAQQKISNGKGKQIHDKIRMKVNEMVAVENRLLLMRNKKSQQAVFNTKRVIIISSILGTMIVLLALFISNRNFKIRRMLEENLINNNVELKILSERALAADKIKSSFLATMSHELRTPLNSIIGFTGIILQELAGPLNPEQKKQLQMVKGSSRHLLSLINDILDISKIEAGQLEVYSEPFNVNDSIDKIINIVSPLVTEKGLKMNLQIEQDLGIIVNDQRRFEQILLNLINNAIKFTDSGEVGLAAYIVQESKFKKLNSIELPVLSICVSDTGIGIKPEDLNGLFEPFKQVDSKLSRLKEGTGLGLAICDRLADLMGGEIHVESIWQKGSTFILSLPYKGNPEL